METKASKSSPEVPKNRLNFTQLVMPTDKILMQIKDKPGLKWLKPLSTSSRKHDPKKYCRFHKDHVHYTNECRDLKEQIKELIHQKFIKRNHKSRSRTKDKPHDDNKDDGRDYLKQAVGEIRMRTGRPISTTGPGMLPGCTSFQGESCLNG